MSSILVLGGAGYIGSHTVYELIAVGENVVVVDNLETGFRKAVHQDAKFYQGDSSLQIPISTDEILKNRFLMQTQSYMHRYIMEIQKN